jgi:YVTN family beta-propeller protein
MKRTSKNSTYKNSAALGAALLTLLGGSAAFAQVDGTNWGTVTAPVYGTSEGLRADGTATSTYSAAELLAGPNKSKELALPSGSFPTYFDGVLPNGKIVAPAGIVTQIGMHPLGSALTPDGQYLVVSNDDERNISNGFDPSRPTTGVSTLPSPTATGGSVNLIGGYTVTVLRTSDMTVAAQTTVNAAFIGLQIVPSGSGYTVYASGGPANDVKVLTFTPPAGSAAGTLTAGTPIKINPITPNGSVTNFTQAATTAAQRAAFNGGDFPENGGGSGSSVGAAQIVFPAGSALSPDGKYLYVACNGDNSLAVISTTTNAVIKQVPVGFLPYNVTVSRDGTKVLVSNWGVEPYSFLAPPTFDGSGNVTALNGAVTPLSSVAAVSSLFYVPLTSTTGSNPKTSSVSVISVPGANPANASLLGSVYEGQPGGVDDRYLVGETHPSATAIVRNGIQEVEYITKTNSDALGMVLVANNRKLADFNLSPLNLNLTGGHQVHGSYPNALAVSPDNKRLYVAEAGLDSVAVLDVSTPTQPKLLGRIPTGWYPSALSVSADGKTLYIVNDKGVAEDLNPKTDFSTNPTASGIESFSNSNSLFGTVQKVNLAGYPLNNSSALNANYAVQNPAALDTSIVPIGGGASGKIKHVIFILHENKTFDSVLGNQTHFGVFADQDYNLASGATSLDTEYTVTGATGFTAITQNTQALADTFATGVNYYSDAEESDGGHQFSASGTASDYTEKTLLVKTGRGLLANKNFEPEDYPEGGYIFNNAARNGVSFKDYGALIRVSGTDNGYANPAKTIDPTSGLAGVPVAPESSPVLNGQNTTSVPPAMNQPTEVASSDVTSPTQGLGQSYFLKNPILAILGENNANGEPHLDKNYPGYNFGISDQRRALEFNKDFDRMAAAGTLPTYIYLYQPNDHTGPAATTNISITGGNPSGAELIADGDTAFGMVVKHIMQSPVYYNSADGTGSAIFFTYDDAQSGRDHLDPHRTPLIVISPYAKPGYLATRHYVTASIVKTEELLMGLPPNNYGDLFATDLRDMFQSTYNGIHLSTDGLTLLGPNQTALVKLHAKSSYVATLPGRKVWKLSEKLDSSSPDQDSYRLSMVTLLSMQADTLYRQAAKKNSLHTAGYKAAQAHVYQAALKVVNGPKIGGGDSDD